MKKLLLLLLIGSFHAAQAQSCNTSFKVQKEGSGAPLLLIPGLYCSGEVWKETVAHFSGRYTCYSLTLPGFAGQAPIQSDSILVQVTDQIACYIRQNKLQKPVIVGHSLGGWVALQLAIKYPNLVGDIVCVSSAPFLPALAMGTDIPVDSARKIGLQIKKGMAAQNAQQVHASQQYALSTMMRDSARITQVLAMAEQSDAATQGEVMYELFSADLRPYLQNIHSRILVLGDWIAYKQYGATHDNVYANFQTQFKKASRVTIAMSDTARHFIMFDDPKWFYSTTDRFLQP